MIEIKSPSRVFLSGPLTMFLKNEKIDSSSRKVIESLIKVLRNDGHDVFSAHELEKWGAETKGIKIEEIMKRDIVAVKQAEYIFVMPYFNKKYSQGTLFLELGPLTARLSTLDKVVRKAVLKRVKLNPPKGVVYLHPKGEKIDGDLKRIVDGFAKAFPRNFEIVEFEKPSDLLKIVKKRLRKPSTAKRFFGRARLNISRKLNRPKGVTYFTPSPRKRPI